MITEEDFRAFMADMKEVKDRLRGVETQLAQAVEALDQVCDLIEEREAPAHTTKVLEGLEGLITGRAPHAKTRKRRR